MPEWLHSLRLRLRALIRRPQFEQDLQDEMVADPVGPFQIREAGASRERYQR